MEKVTQNHEIVSLTEVLLLTNKLWSAQLDGLKLYASARPGCYTVVWRSDLLSPPHSELSRALQATPAEDSSQPLSTLLLCLIPAP